MTNQAQDKGHHRHTAAGNCTGHSSAAASDAENATKVKDPVCGMTVDPAMTPHHAMQEGQDYHFCSDGCRAKFVADPGRYPRDKPGRVLEAATDAMWTCPMHPQIRRTGPGTCPICGMALEPEEPSLDDGPNPELVDFTRRTWVAAFLTAPLLAISMVAEMLGIHGVPPAFNPWAQLALTTPIVLWAGRPFFERG